MGRKKPAARWTVEQQSPLHTAAEHLKVGQFEQVANCLKEAQFASEKKGEAIAALFLVLARRICLAGSQCQAEMRWHQKAYQEAQQREHELRCELDRLLHLIRENQPPTKFEEQQGWVSDSLAVQHVLAPAERPSLRQRLRNMLRRRSGPQESDSLLPEAPAQDLISLLPENLEGSMSPSTPAPESPSARTVEQTEVPALQPAEETGKPASPPTEGSEAMAELLCDEAKLASFVKVEEPRRRPSFVVYCLGQFRVYQDDQPVQDWPSSKGKAIFKYLVTHRERPIPKEVLMELLWPGAHPDAARNNLNVAIYGLRQALRHARPSFSHVLFQDDCYLLNPGLQIWLDVDEFEKQCKIALKLEKQGKCLLAMSQYRAAEALYQGEFLEEDRYEDWPLPLRQSLQARFLELLDCLSRYDLDQENYAACAMASRKMLAVDPCCEEAHRRLMRCYSRQGQPYLALRQYHLCVEALQGELDVTPSPATTQLYERIRFNEKSSLPAND